MYLKASKRGSKKENYESITFIVASLTVVLIHCCIWFEQNINCEGL